MSDTSAVSFSSPPSGVSSSEGSIVGSAGLVPLSNKISSEMLNDADKTCEDLVKLENGNYRSYYAIQISKKELVNKVADALSQEQELEIQFHRDQFRKYAAEYLEKQGDK